MGSKLLERIGIAKATEPSLDDIQRMVYAAWSEATKSRLGYEAASSYVRETYKDHAIVCVGEDHYSVPFTIGDDGVAFDLEGATEVEHVWAGVEKTVVITKTDDDRHVAFGWAYVYERDGAQVVDHSGEFIEKAEVLEDAAYLFNLNFREGDDMHGADVKARLVESFVSTPEKLEKLGLEPDALPHGWWTGWHIDDPDLWDAIKTGDRPMLSIGGVATKELV